jgi:hypothetical protein
VRVGYVRVSSVDQNTVRQLEGVAVERTFGTSGTAGVRMVRGSVDVGVLEEDAAGASAAPQRGQADTPGGTCWPHWSQNTTPPPRETAHRAPPRRPDQPQKRTSTQASPVE